MKMPGTLGHYLGTDLLHSAFRLYCTLQAIVNRGVRVYELHLQHMFSQIADWNTWKLNHKNYKRS